MSSKCQNLFKSFIYNLCWKREKSKWDTLVQWLDYLIQMNNKHTTMSMMVHVMELVGKITYLFLVGKKCTDSG